MGAGGVLRVIFRHGAWRHKKEEGETPKQAEKSEKRERQKREKRKRNTHKKNLEKPENT